MIHEYRFANISEKDKALPFLINTAGREEQASLYREYGIEHHQFLFTTGGQGETVMNGKKIPVTPGTLMYHAPNTTQRYYPVSEKWVVYWITFTQAINLFSAKNGVYQLGEIDEFIDPINEIIALEPGFLYCEQASALLYKIILSANRRIENVRYDEAAHKLHAALEYINKMFYRDIELSNLSRMCGISEEYFCRLFKKTYGVSAFSYIRTLRMQEAKKRLLLYKKQSLSEIAESVGYHSVNYFLTDFKKSENITPTEFRRLHQSDESKVFDDTK